MTRGPPSLRLDLFGAVSAPRRSKWKTVPTIWPPALAVPGLTKKAARMITVKTELVRRFQAAKGYRMQIPALGAPCKSCPWIRREVLGEATMKHLEAANAETLFFCHTAADLGPTIQRCGAVCAGWRKTGKRYAVGIAERLGFLVEVATTKDLPRSRWRFIRRPSRAHARYGQNPGDA